MKRTTLIAGILVATSAIAATAVLAAGPGYGMRGEHGFGMYGGPPTFDSLDADKDGEITPAEMEAHRQSRFSQADGDGDGKITKDEMIAAAQVRMEQRIDTMLERFDADGDGALTAEEMPQPPRPGRMFQFADEDGNGSISKEEFDQMGRHHRHGGGWGMRRGAPKN